MAQKAAQEASAAFQKIPQTLKDYSASGKMDADLRDFGTNSAQKIYEGISLFFDQRAAGLGTKMIVANAEVAATLGVIRYATEGTVNAFDAATGAQRELLDNSRRTFATVTSTLGATMSNLTDKSGYYVAESVRNTLQKVEDSNKEAAKRTLTTANNMTVTLYDLLPNFAETLQSTNQAVLLDSQTYYRAGLDMTEKSLTNTAALQRGFGFTSAEINAFVLRDIEKTGKATGDTVLQVVAAAYAAADALGAAPRITAEQIKHMTNDVERYGNSSTAQMGAVSKQLQELSLDIGSLDKLVNTFSGFDSAISKSNDLAALFGVQLDSMEAMYLAAEDPTRLLETIREQLIDQGVDVSNMSQSQLRALSKTLGMTVEETKRYLQGDLVTSYEEAYTKIEEGTARALTAPEAVAERTAKMGADGAAMTAAQAEKAQADKMSAATIKQTYAEVVAQSNQAISAALGEANNKQKDLYATTLDATKKSLESFNKDMPELITQFVLPYFEEAIKKIQATFKGANSALPATSPTPTAATGAAAPAATPAPVAVPVVPPVISAPPQLPAPAPEAAPPQASAPTETLEPTAIASAQPVSLTGQINVLIGIDPSTGSLTATTSVGGFENLGDLRVVTANAT